MICNWFVDIFSNQFCGNLVRFRFLSCNKNDIIEYERTIFNILDDIRRETLEFLALENAKSLESLESLESLKDKKEGATEKQSEWGIKTIE